MDLKNTQLQQTFGNLVTVGTSAGTPTLGQIENGNGDPLTQVTLGLGSVGAPSCSFTGDVNTGLFASGADAIGLVTGGTSRLAIDSSGNVGIGTASPATILDVASGNSGGDAGADAPVLRISNTTQGNDWDLEDAIGTIEIFAKDTSGNSPYSTAFIKSLNEQANGTLPSGSLSFGTAKYNASGGAVERMRIDQNGNIVIKNTEATPSTVTDSVHLFAQDVSSSSELKVRDEAGNTTTLSPHNFSLIPNGASEDMAWSYYSEKNGKKINVDMLKLARMVEELTGETLVYQK